MRMRSATFGHSSACQSIVWERLPYRRYLKLELPSSEVMRLSKLVPLRHMTPAKQVTQVSLYFDTDKFALRKNGVMFRVRRTGHRCGRYSRPECAERPTRSRSGDRRSKWRWPAADEIRSTQATQASHTGQKASLCAQFFETVLSGKKVSRLRTAFLSALEEVQDCLDDLNDISVHEHLTAEIATEPAPSTKAQDRARRAFAAGVLTGQEEARINTVMAAAVASFKRLASAKPFWK